MKGETIHFVAPPPILVDVPIKCDSSGDIFVTYTGNPYAGSDGGANPVTEILLDSKSTVQFKVHPIDGYGTEDRQSFGLDQNGTLYALIAAYRTDTGGERARKPDYFIEKFNEDGTRDSLAQLLLPTGARMLPMVFGIFSDGSYLITGMSVTSSGANPSQIASGPFTALFDSSGRFVKFIRLPDDLPPAPATQQPPRAGQQDESGHAHGGTSAELSVLQGGIVSAADGNIYLIRASNPIKIYGISPGGQVVSRMRAPIPKPALSLIDAGASAAGLYLHFGHIANGVSSGATDPQNMVALFDLTTKRFVALYKLPADVSQDWVPACADNRGNFSFLGAGPDGRLQVTTYLQH